MSDSPITPEQCRAARGLLGLSQDDLCKLAGVSRVPIAGFEGGKTKTYANTIDKLRNALEGAGVDFVDPNGASDGVRLRQAIWKLVPLNPESQNWRASTYKGAIIIRAATEDRARRIASMAFGIATKRVLGEDTIVNPWGRIIGEASCERITKPEYPEDGPDEILDPAEHDHEWRR